MKARKSFDTQMCADCGKIIPALKPHAIKQVPGKNILFTPVGEKIFKEVPICLTHVYKKAEHKRVKQFSFLGVE